MAVGPTGAGELAPEWALLVLVGWAAVALVAGYVRFRRFDA